MNEEKLALIGILLLLHLVTQNTKTYLFQSSNKISYNEKKINVCRPMFVYTMHVQNVCGYHAVSLQPSEDSAYDGILCEIASDAYRVLYEASYLCSSVQLIWLRFAL